MSTNNDDAPFQAPLKATWGRRFEIDGELLTMAQIAARSGMSVAAIWRRVQSGWTGRDLMLSRRVGGRAPRLVAVCGEQLSASEIAARAGITTTGVLLRQRRGLTEGELVAASGRRARPSEKVLSLIGSAEAGHESSSFIVRTGARLRAGDRIVLVIDQGSASA